MVINGYNDGDVDGCDNIMMIIITCYHHALWK